MNKVALTHRFYHNSSFILGGDGLMDGEILGLQTEENGRVKIVNDAGNVLFTGSFFLYNTLISRGYINVNPSRSIWG